MYKLFGRPGWGSVLVEAQLAWYGLPYSLVEMDDLFASAVARASLAAVNPLAQIPTLVLPDGTIMTESAAITILLAEQSANALAPPANDPARANFLRWLIFIVANIYPTFTYADDPARFVSDPAAQPSFRAGVDRHGERLWQMVETASGTPWFLGAPFSALDIYICAITHWRPRRRWFAAHAPRLHAIGQAADHLPALVPIWSRNFPADQENTI